VAGVLCDLGRLFPVDSSTWRFQLHPWCDAGIGDRHGSCYILTRIQIGISVHHLPYSHHQFLDRRRLSSGTDNCSPDGDFHNDERKESFSSDDGTTTTRYPMNIQG